MPVRPRLRITSATTASSGTSYTLSAVGNMTARGSDSLSYDLANRLTGTTVGSTAATYTYIACPDEGGATASVPARPSAAPRLPTYTT